MHSYPSVRKDELFVRYAMDMVHTSPVRTD
jgi:hypothetical protein